MFQPIRLTVAPEMAHIAPGSKQILLLTVQNATSIVDRINLTVSGLPSDWYSLDKSNVSLFPGVKDEIQLILHPPTDASVISGDHPFVVHATSEDDPKLHASSDIVLHVSAVSALAMEVTPISAEGHDANFTVSFLNKTKQPAALSLIAFDNQQALDYRIQPEGTLTIPPGEKREVQVRVEPHTAETVGEPHPYTIEFRGMPEGSFRSDAPDPLLVRQATFTYQPQLSAAVIPIWLRRLPGWALLLLLLALLLLVFLAGNRATAIIASSPSKTALPTASPVVAKSPTIAPTWTVEVSTAVPATPTAIGPKGPAPQIVNFAVQVDKKGSLGLVWSVLHAKTVLLNGQPVSTTGQMPVHVTGQTLEVLSATGDGGSASQVMSVTPPPHATLVVQLPPTNAQLPVITLFTARPDPKTGVLSLLWQVTGAKSTSLNSAQVALNGSQPVAPGGTGVYVLVASNDLGSTTSKLTLPPVPTPRLSHIVLPQPSIPNFSLQHPHDGQPYTLSWTTTNATLVTLNGQTVASTGSKPLAAPVQPGVYKLVATNSIGQTEAQVQVQVGAGT